MGDNMKQLLWIEAESFQDRGGWVVDTQFIDIMGSSYLLANGMGTPVKNARHVLTAPAGTYKLWVRTKDWLPEYHPGVFQLLINGKESELFGTSGIPGWRWEYGGDFTLDGKVQLELVDKTGFYGRCDAIILSTDPNFIPPDDPKTIEKLRRKYAKQMELKNTYYDVIIIGGGLAGCTAAVAAARNGCKVALIQNRPILGGNASSELLIPPVGHWNGRDMQTDPAYSIWHLNPRETGIVEEYRTTGIQRTREAALYTPRLTYMVENEPNIDLYLNTHAIKAIMSKEDDTIIEAAEIINTISGEWAVLRGKIFIDCSGDSAFAVSAGALYRQGKESKAMHNEPWAPDEPSTDTMGNGIIYYVFDTFEEQNYNAPPWAYKFENCSDFAPGRHPSHIGEIGGNLIDDPLEAITTQWKLELGGTMDTFADSEEIRDSLFRLVYGIWDHTKNHCPQYKDKAKTCILKWVGYIAGKRENRRLIGDYILTMNDIYEGTDFPDKVAYGAWAIDDHYSEGFFYNGSYGKHYDDRDYACYGKEFSIPLRSLYSKNIKNLFMAGRNISATHLAMSDTRVMLTCALMGHAVGDAAAICLKYDCLPRSVYQNYIDVLQNMLLREGAHLIGMAYNNEDNIAKSSKVSASSESTDYNGKPMTASEVLNGFTRPMNGSLNAWKPNEDSPGPHWLRFDWEKPVTFNVIEITFQTRDKAPKQFYIEAQENGKFEQIFVSNGKRVRREVIPFDKAITTDAVKITLGELAGICEVRIYHVSQEEIQVYHRIRRNMKREDKDIRLPWELQFSTNNRIG